MRSNVYFLFESSITYSEGLFFGFSYMANTLEADFNLTHSIINYLNMQYRAHFAFLNALQYLSSPDVTDTLLKTTQKNLTMVVKWNQDLIAGMPIFSANWRYPESFEAQKAFDLLTEVNTDIEKVGSILKTISEEEKPLEKPEDLKFMIAVNLRYYYARENFLKGFVEFGKARNQDNLVSYYSDQLPAAAEEIKKATALMREFKDNNSIQEGALEELRDMLIILRGVFNSYHHDICVLRSVYQGDFNYELAGIKVEEAAKWKHANFTAYNAGYWKAYGFNIDEALSWVNSNFTDPSAAYVWRYHGFSPEESFAWISLGILPKFAKDLIKKGYNPETAYQTLVRYQEKNSEKDAA